MNAFNFTELKRKVESIEDLNAKKLCLYRALADYQQNVLYVNDFPMQVQSAIVFYEKINELSAPDSSPQDGIFSKSRNLKVTISIVFELLKMINKGKNVNDSTVLSSLVSLISGFSYDYTLNTVQKGFYLTEKHHGTLINEANDVLVRLGLPIQIDTKKQY